VPDGTENDGAGRFRIRVIEYTVLADLERALTSMLPVPAAVPARVLLHPTLTL
jgi:hypothetical protein